MRRRGFSVAELLVVLAILGVLAALLFPVLASAMKRGKESKCVANLRQMATGLTLYRSDNDGKGFILDMKHRPANSTNGYGDFERMGAYLRSPSVLECPEPSVHAFFSANYTYPAWPDRLPDDPPTGIGSLRRPFVPDSGVVVAYCQNHLLPNHLSTTEPQGGKYVAVREDTSVKSIPSGAVQMIHCDHTGCSEAGRTGLRHLSFPGEPELVLER